MSESVKIGGIGKNPAIDRINSLNAMDVKGHAVKRMEQVLLGGDFFGNRMYTRDVPIDFENVDWKGERDGGRKGRNCLAGDNRSGRKAVSGASGQSEKNDGGNGMEKISVQPETAGNVLGPGRGQDIHIQHFGEAAAGRAGVFRGSRDTEVD